jgi:hypothetical protein
MRWRFPTIEGLLLIQDEPNNKNEDGLIPEQKHHRNATKLPFGALIVILGPKCESHAHGVRSHQAPREGTARCN